jgi:hypothetical protein
MEKQPIDLSGYITAFTKWLEDALRRAPSDAVSLNVYFNTLYGAGSDPFIYAKTYGSRQKGQAGHSLQWHYEAWSNDFQGPPIHPFENIDEAAQVMYEIVRKGAETSDLLREKLKKKELDTFSWNYHNENPIRFTL